MVYPTAAVARLALYNDGPYDASTNPYGMDSGGYIVNFPLAVDDIAAVAVWINSLESDMAAVAAIDTEIAAVAAVVANVTTVAGIAAEVAIVSGDSAAIQALAALTSELSALAALTTEISALAALTAEIAAVAAVAGNLAAFANSGGIVYELAASTSGDPGAGKFGFNHATPGSSTGGQLDDLDYYGAPAAARIAGWSGSTSTIKGTAEVVKLGDPTVRGTVQVTAQADGTGFRAVTWVPVSGTFTGTFTPGDLFGMTFIRSGDAGSTGNIIAKVRFATTANADLAGGGLAAGTTHDGVTAALNDLVLVAAQTAPEENGYYRVPSSGAASRDSEFTSYNSIAGSQANVSEGTAYADTTFRCTSDAGGTIGSTALTFVRADVPGANLTTAEKNQAQADLGFPASPVALDFMRRNAAGSAWENLTPVATRTALSVAPVIATAAPLVMNRNPAGLVDQELAGTVATDGAYADDQRYLAKVGIAGTCTLASGAETAVAGLKKRLRLAMPIEATGTDDYALVRTPLEGNHMARMGWNAGGGVMTLAALVRSNVGGVKTLGIQRSDDGASYLMETADLVADAVTFEYHLITAPTSNAAWKDDNTLWGWLTLCGRAGSNLAAAEGAWQAGEYYAGSGHANNDASAENLDMIAWVLLPGIVPITAADMPYLARSADEEERLCRRFYNRKTGTAEFELGLPGYTYVTNNQQNFFDRFDEKMRDKPTFACSDAADFYMAVNSTTLAATGLEAAKTDPWGAYLVTHNTSATANFPASLHIDSGGSGWLAYSARLT